MGAHRTVVCEHGFMISTCRCAHHEKAIVVKPGPCVRSHRSQFGPYIAYVKPRVPEYVPKHRKEVGDV